MMVNLSDYLNQLLKVSPLVTNMFCMRNFLTCGKALEIQPEEPGSALLTKNSKNNQLNDSYAFGYNFQPQSELQHRNTDSKKAQTSLNDTDNDYESDASSVF